MSEFEVSFPMPQITGTGVVTPPAFNPEDPPLTVPTNGRWFRYEEGTPELVAKSFLTVSKHLGISACTSQLTTDDLVKRGEWVGYGYVIDDIVWALVALRYNAEPGYWYLRGMFTWAFGEPLQEVYEDFMLEKLRSVMKDLGITEVHFDREETDADDRLFNPMFAAVSRQSQPDKWVLDVLARPEGSMTQPFRLRLTTHGLNS